MPGAANRRQIADVREVVVHKGRNIATRSVAVGSGLGTFPIFNTDKAQLAFGELRAASCTAEAVFFAFDFAGVAGEQAFVAQFLFGFRVENL